MLALEVNALQKSYHNDIVLRGIDLQIAQGESFGFAGANGAGKSTMLNCLLNFCYYEAGEIRLFGVSCKNRLARERIAFLPERFIPPYYLIGEQFLHMMMKLRGVDYSPTRAKEMLAALDLHDSAMKKPVRSFSKGMTQKLGLAACFLSERDFYILDEPMSGLDPKSRALVKRQFKALRERGATLFFTSHMLADIDEICSDMAVLHGGKIRYRGAPSGMRQAFSGADTLEEAYLRAISDDEDNARPL